MITRAAQVVNIIDLEIKNNWGDLLEYKEYLIMTYLSILIVVCQLIMSTSLTRYCDCGVQIKLPKDLPDELLYGRVGFLWACLFLNKHLGQGTVPSSYTVSLVFNSCYYFCLCYAMNREDGQ